MPERYAYRRSSRECAPPEARQRQTTRESSTRMAPSTIGTMMTLSGSTISARNSWEGSLDNKLQFFALSQLQGVEGGWPGRREPDDEHSPAS